jgi:hypothetical protein
MKETSDTSFLSRPQAMQASQAEGSPGHLFLGHKLLGELKILMRLSSGAKSGRGDNHGGSDGESSF